MGDQILKISLFRIENVSISLLWLLKLALAFLIVTLLSVLLKRFLKSRLARRRGMSQGNRETISTIVSSGVAIVGYVTALHANGLTLAPLAVTLGGLGIGIGLGFQEFAKNLISGVTLLFEGKLQVGDYVEFEGLSGHIKEISVRSTIICTPAGGDFVVPNSDLTSKRVLNWSYRSFTGQLHLPIKVADDCDPALVTETLLNSAHMEPRVLPDPPPKVIFKGFADSSLEFELWVWVARMDEGISVESSLNFLLEYNLRQMGLRTPLPVKASHQAVSIRDALRQLPHFSTSSDLELRELIETGYQESLAKTDVLFNEGAMGSNFYLILSGSVEIVVKKLDQTIKVYHAGEVFGEAAVMLNLPYTSTARALEDTSLFVIHKTSFEKHLRLHPDLTEAFTQEMTKDKEVYQGVRQQLQDLGLLSAAEHRQRFAVWVQTRLKNLFSA